MNPSKPDFQRESFCGPYAGTAIRHQLRELQEMLLNAEECDHSTIYRWFSVMRLKGKRLRWYWRNPSDLCPWHMD
nr:Mobile element protein [Escherichia coli]